LGIIKDYSLPVLYVHSSIYDLAGKELTDNKTELAHKFFVKAVAINTKLPRLIKGMRATYTTDKTLDHAKEQEYADRFQNLIKLGRNLAYPESCDEEHSEKDVDLIICANKKDSDIIGKVKIVAHGNNEIIALRKIVQDRNYELFVVELNEAISDLDYIQNYIKEALIPPLSKN